MQSDFSFLKVLPRMSPSTQSSKLRPPLYNFPLEGWCQLLYLTIVRLCKSALHLPHGSLYYSSLERIVTLWIFRAWSSFHLSYLKFWSLEQVGFLKGYGQASETWNLPCKDKFSVLALNLWMLTVDASYLSICQEMFFPGYSLNNVWSLEGIMIWMI